MSAFRILLAELARGGGQTTYGTLLRRHGDDYDQYDFAAAVYKARRLGLVENAYGGRGGRKRPIVAAAAAVCPCCGRKL